MHFTDLACRAAPKLMLWLPLIAGSFAADVVLKQLSDVLLLLLLLFLVDEAVAASSMRSTTVPALIVLWATEWGSIQALLDLFGNAGRRGAGIDPRLLLATVADGPDASVGGTTRVRSVVAPDHGMPRARSGDSGRQGDGHGGDARSARLCAWRLLFFVVELMVVQRERFFRRHPGHGPGSRPPTWFDRVLCGGSCPESRRGRSLAPDINPSDSARRSGARPATRPLAASAHAAPRRGTLQIPPWSTTCSARRSTKSSCCCCRRELDNCTGDPLETWVQIEEEGRTAGDALRTGRGARRGVDPPCRAGTNDDQLPVDVEAMTPFDQGLDHADHLPEPGAGGEGSGGVELARGHLLSVLGTSIVRRQQPPRPRVLGSSCAPAPAWPVAQVGHSLTRDRSPNALAPRPFSSAVVCSAYADHDALS